MIAFSTSPTTTLDSSGGKCMYEQVDSFRDMGPAVPVQLPEGVSAWSVTRGDVARLLLTHPGVSRNLKKNVPSYQPGSVPWLSPWVDVDSMATAEGKEHARLRKLITPAFTPRRVEAMRPQVETIVTRLLDELESQPGDRPSDLHATFSYRLPTEMICELFGVPDEQRTRVLDLFVAVGRTDVSEEESLAVNEELVAAMRTLIETKRRDPGDDLTSFLLAAHEEGDDPLTEHELISTLLLMIGGGSTTTINLIDHTVRELLAHPEQLNTVRTAPERFRDAIEESLRAHCPVMHLPMRWAIEDIDLGEGVTIRAGDAILICYGAHGRDPGVHEDPATFDIERSDKEHLAFGLGAHFCPGSHLARLEAEVALPALFDRFPRLELAVAPDETEPEHTFIGNGLTALPVFLRHE
ncbi:cytochrome P450 [Actinopolyspora erythraea]|uniref:Cytochrome P450 n=1 Tax=Actinopolyspora erythraea TaxID=414996 RepID=A0A099D5U3_9ACTN|nr:cytochrome P450 [Actinopolyspora erythraea]ASU78972.1 cytochrome P450 [Actinopolyspora erythraea]KGI81306.1 cytochrome P450 [Actinopolyspora erythraea]